MVRRNFIPSLTLNNSTYGVSHSQESSGRCDAKRFYRRQSFNNENFSRKFGSTASAAFASNGKSDHACINGKRVTLQVR